MTPRSLFNIILKIFGLFFLREVINTIPQVISSFLLYYNSADIGDIIGPLIASIIILTFYILLVLQLLFRSNKIIDVLKLDQGFNEDQLSFEEKGDFDIPISEKFVLTTALIVIGGVILADHIPDFCRQLYLYLSQRGIGYNSFKYDMSYFVFSAAKIIIGLLILGERKRIVDFIENRKHKTSTEPEDE